MSAWPIRRIASACEKVVRPPVATIGVLNPASFTARLIAATRGTLRPNGPAASERTVGIHSYRSARCKDRLPGQPSVAARLQTFRPWKDTENQNPREQTRLRNKSHRQFDYRPRSPRLLETACPQRSRFPPSFAPPEKLRGATADDFRAVHHNRHRDR